MLCLKKRLVAVTAFNIITTLIPLLIGSAESQITTDYSLNASNSKVGISVLEIDIDNDNINEQLIIEPFYSESKVRMGQIRILKNDMPYPSANNRIVGKEFDEQLGTKVEIISEHIIAVGQPGANGKKGVVSIYDLQKYVQGLPDAKVCELQNPGYQGNVAKVNESFGANIAKLNYASGITKLAISAPEYLKESIGGRVDIFNVSDCSLANQFISPEPGLNVNFGFALAALGDQNADGNPELVISAPATDVFFNGVSTNEAGAVYVFSGSNFSQLGSKIIGITQSHGYFGNALAAIPDSNNDNLEDILIGQSFFTDAGLLHSGIAYVYGKNSSSWKEIAQLKSQQAMSQFGYSLISTKGSSPLLVIGAPESSYYGDSKGAVMFFSNKFGGGTYQQVDSLNGEHYSNFGSNINLLPASNINNQRIGVSSTFPLTNDAAILPEFKAFTLPFSFEPTKGKVETLFTGCSTPKNTSPKIGAKPVKLDTSKKCKQGKCKSLRLLGSSYKKNIPVACIVGTQLLDTPMPINSAYGCGLRVDTSEPHLLLGSTSNKKGKLSQVMNFSGDEGDEDGLFLNGMADPSLDGLVIYAQCFSGATVTESTLNIIDPNNMASSTAIRITLGVK